MCQATDSADSSKRKCFLCSIRQHICNRTPCYIPSLLRIPPLPPPPLQTKPVSRLTGQRARPTATSAAEGSAGGGKAVALPTEAVATAVPSDSFLKSPSESPELIAPPGPTPRRTPWLSNSNVLLGALPPKGTRATSAYRGITYTLVVLTWGLQKQTISRNKAGGDDKVLPPLHVTAQGHPPCAACGSSWARTTQPLLCLWAVTRIAAKQVKKATPALHAPIAWTANSHIRLPLGPGMQRWPPSKPAMSYMGDWHSSMRAFLIALTRLPSFCRKHVAPRADVKSPTFLPAFWAFFQ